MSVVGLHSKSCVILSLFFLFLDYHTLLALTLFNLFLPLFFLSVMLLHNIQEFMTKIVLWV